MLTPPLPPSQTASLHGRWEGSQFLPCSVGQGRLVYPASKVNKLLTSCRTAGSLRQGNPVDQSLGCSSSENMLIWHLWAHLREEAESSQGPLVSRSGNLGGRGNGMASPRSTLGACHPVPGPTACPEQEVCRLDFPAMVSSGLCLFEQDLLRGALLPEAGPLRLPPQLYG